MLPLLLEIGYGEHAKLQHGKLKPVFHSLQAVKNAILYLTFTYF